MWQNLINKISSNQDKKEINGNESIAVILVRAAKTDNSYTDSEKKLIDEILIKQMKFEPEDAIKLRVRAEFLETEINDNIQLTRIIKKEIPYEDRDVLIQQLWRIILDDDMRTPEENKFMRVLSYLLGVSDIKSAQARSKAFDH